MSDSAKPLIDFLMNDSTRAWLVAFTTSIGAILAWIAKLKWAEEYKTVVEARIAFTEKQVEFAEKQVEILANFTPDKMKDHFAGMRQIEEERIALLEQELERAKQEINDNRQIISDLKKQANFRSEEIEKLEEARAILDKKVAYIKEQLSIIAERDDQIAEILEFMNTPGFPVETVNAVLKRFDSEKSWILSEARENMRRAETSRHSASQKTHAEMRQKERKLAEMRRTTSLDEDYKK